MTTELITLRGEKAIPHLEDLVKLKLEFLEGYPFLSKGDREAEKAFLRTLITCPECITVIAKREGKIIGAFLGVALAHSSLKTSQLPNASSKFYLSEILLKDCYQKRGIGKALFTSFENEVKTHPEFTSIVILELEVPEDDPEKPSDYRCPKRFWQERKFTKLPHKHQKSPHTFHLWEKSF